MLTRPEDEKRPPSDVIGNLAWVIIVREPAGVEFLAENGGGA